METEILQELQSIRSFMFIIMFMVIIWAFFKILESIINIVTSFKKAWDTDFENRVDKLINTGDYEKAIDTCKEKLVKYPNHIDANWYLAKAYYYTENNDKLSEELFKKIIYLVPSWEENANAYLEEIKNR
ncbi:MAG: hypothetical protein COB61_003410 [Thiotrichales bacterium]|nr:hypothetical protein [Thiotrichales bacterium]